MSGYDFVKELEEIAAEEKTATLKIRGTITNACLEKTVTVSYKGDILEYIKNNSTALFYAYLFEKVEIEDDDGNVVGEVEIDDVEADDISLYDVETEVLEVY